MSSCYPTNKILWTTNICLPFVDLKEIFLVTKKRSTNQQNHLKQVLPLQSLKKRGKCR